ncbi:hypothetical protein [Falsiroseomonas stagni]|uniref:hypothetical protein n=1 Tax=Falsiroseomonas stagni TaxID=484882 RepID=UPI000B862BEC|nr:hypothetical protein [Falsiroseomonas stagni]
MVVEALEALRNSDESLGEAITRNLDGPVTGRDTEAGRSLNFDPSSQLSWAVTDLNGDGRAEVFLLFFIPTGTAAPPGVVMQRHGDGWRVACEIADPGLISRGSHAVPGLIQLLPARTQGWRHFRVFSGSYGWYPAPDAPGAMNCAPLPLGTEMRRR